MGTATYPIRSSIPSIRFMCALNAWPSGSLTAKRPERLPSTRVLLRRVPFCLPAITRPPGMTVATGAIGRGSGQGHTRYSASEAIPAVAIRGSRDHLQHLAHGLGFEGDLGRDLARLR